MKHITIAGYLFILNDIEAISPVKTIYGLNNDVDSYKFSVYFKSGNVIKNVKFTNEGL